MGIGESIKGAVKEQLGDAVGNDSLKAEGDAQQTKGDEQTRETRDRAEAQAHEKKADELEKEQAGLES